MDKNRTCTATFKGKSSYIKETDVKKSQREMMREVKDAIFRLDIDSQNELIIEELFVLLNIMGNDRVLYNVLPKILLNEHRTIQQNFWRLIHRTAEEYKEQRFDMRNQASVEFAKHITLFGEALPFV